MDDRTIIEDVRHATNIVRLISEYVSLRRAGTRMVGLCPFHSEKAPSFTVNEERQMFHCFGCKRGGDAFKFLMLIENYSFPEALSHLAERASIELPRKRGDWKGSTTDERDRARKIQRLAQKFFARSLQEPGPGSEARKFLTARGIDGTAIETFGLGLAPPSWDGLIRAAATASISAEALEKCGLTVRRHSQPGHFDRFRNRVTIPIHDAQGTIIAFGGRILGQPGPREAKFINSPETILFSKGNHLYGLNFAGKSIREHDEAVLVEGYFDVIQAHRAGVTNAVAPLGTSLTGGQARLLSRFTRKVLINFDADQAGDEAARRSIKTFLEEGFDVRVVALPAGEDPDEFIRKHGAESYREKLEAALPFFEYLLEQGLARHDLRRPGEKLAVIQDVLPFLLSVKEKIKQREFIPLISQLVRVDEQLVLEKLLEMQQRSQGGAFRQPKRSPARAEGPGLAERKLLGLMLSSKEVRYRALQALNGMPLEGLSTAGLLRTIMSLAEDGKDVNFLSLHDVLPEESAERRLVSALANEPLGSDSADDEADLIEEAEGCLTALNKIVLKSRIEEVQRRLANPAAAEDTELARTLLEEKMSLVRKLSRLD